MKGHLSKACRKDSKRDFSRTEMITPRNRNHPKNYNLEKKDKIASDDQNSVYHVHYVDYVYYVNPLKVEMKVNNQNINFEVDTGSGITLLSETTYQEKLSNYNLTNTKIAIKTYANESLNVLGKFSVTVQYKDGGNLLGRNWLSEVLFNRCREKVKKS